MPIKTELIPFLDAAFGRGLRLVPLGMNNGAPQVNKGMRQNVVVATTLQEARDKWIYGEACAYGVICGNGVIVVDVDTDIPEALSNFKRHNFPETFRVATPSGGFHLYYSVPVDKKFNSSMGDWYGKGVEIKGTGGRVTGWGSVVYKGNYRIVDPKPFTPAPDWLIQKAERVKVDPAKRGEPAYEKAEAYIKTAPVAIEGQGGDNQTFEVAQTLIRYNLERPAIEVLMRIYNKEKCKPMWNESGLQAKIDSAFQCSEYAPSFDFNDPFAPPIAQGEELQFHTLAELENMPPPEYVLDDRLIRHQISFLIGRSGAGKTLVLIDWIFFLTQQGKRVLCLIGENLSDFIQRTRAWRSYYELEKSPDGILFLQNGKFITMAHTNELFALEASGKKFDVIVIDTFERFTTSEFNINQSSDMMAVIERLESLAKHCDASILCAHHLPRNEDRIKGSNTLDGAVSVIILLKEKDGRIWLKNTRNKSGKEGAEWTYDIIPSGDSIVAIPQADNTPEPKVLQKDKTKRILDKTTESNHYLVRNAVLKVLRETEENEGLSVSALAQAVNIQVPFMVIATIETWIRSMVSEGDAEILKYVSVAKNKTLNFRGLANEN